MKRTTRKLNRKLRRFATALSGASLTLLLPSLSWATSVGGGTMPWDTTLNTIQTDLSGPVAHALVTSAFVGSGILYACGGGHGPGVNRLAAAGLGGAAALGAIQVMGYLFPYSPVLF
jgi:type IV secretory pathway VirB2 component (pilin)